MTRYDVRCGACGNREVQFRSGGPIDAAVFDIRHDSDDVSPRGRPARFDAVTDRALVGPIGPGERLVDDGDRRGRSAIPGIEEPALHQVRADASRSTADPTLL